MKLPNGYGSVYKLSGKRRNPWAVRKTVGWTFNEEKKKSYPKYEFIGFYKTRQEALQSLAEYNKNPYQINTENITLEELYEMWSNKHFDRVSETSRRNYQSAWKICEPIQFMTTNNLKLIHIQTMIDESGKNRPMLEKLKMMLGQMYDFGVQNEIIPKDKRDIIRYIDLGNRNNPNRLERSPFTKQEIDKLWDNILLDPVFSITIMLIYTGLRVGELIDLKKEDVHLTEQCFFINASKTKTGIREVPIANKIMPIFKFWFTQNMSEYLISTTTGRQIIYSNLRSKKWTKINSLLESNHHLHDTRHTFVSLMTEAGVDERIIKPIIGHKGSNITESIYTHIDLKTKLEAVNKI